MEHTIHTPSLFTYSSFRNLFISVVRDLHEHEGGVNSVTGGVNSVTNDSKSHESPSTNESPSTDTEGKERQARLRRQSSLKRFQRPSIHKAKTAALLPIGSDHTAGTEAANRLKSSSSHHRMPLNAPKGPKETLGQSLNRLSQQSKAPPKAKQRPSVSRTSLSGNLRRPSHRLSQFLGGIADVDNTSSSSLGTNDNKKPGAHTMYFEKLCWACEELEYPFEYADIVGSQFLGLDGATPVSHGKSPVHSILVYRTSTSPTFIAFLYSRGSRTNHGRAGRISSNGICLPCGLL
jgi:hypothetical protein